MKSNQCRTIFHSKLKIHSDLFWPWRPDTVANNYSRRWIFPKNFGFRFQTDGNSLAPSAQGPKPPNQPIKSLLEANKPIKACSLKNYVETKLRNDTKSHHYIFATKISTFWIFEIFEIFKIFDRTWDVLSINWINWRILETFDLSELPTHNRPLI